MRFGHVITALLLAIPLVGTAAQAADTPLKVGFVYVGPVGDSGWTYEHDQGRKYLEKQLGDKVKTTYVENVSEGPDALRVIRKLAEDGNKLIFTTSFGFMNPTLRVARNHPNVTFEHATGYKTSDNLGTYSARWYQGRYLTGLIAGSMTKTNDIGYVAAYPIPEVIRGINAFTLGVREVNPKAQVKVVFTNGWYNPGRERQAAETLVSQGADILSKHQDSPAVIQVASEHDIYCFGYDSDQAHFGPDAVLTSIVNNWGPYYVSVAKKVLNGTWKSTQVWGGLDSGMVYLAKLNDAVPDDTKALVRKKEAAIKSGDLKVFTGPIRNQDGKVVVADGKSLSDSKLLRMDYFVEGVQGKLPKK